MEKLIKAIKCLLPHTALSMLTGKLLGDGNISIEKKRNPRFRFSHTTHDKEWCFHCYGQLKSYIPLAAPKYRKIPDNRVKQGYTESYYVQSYVCQEASLLKEIWYPQDKKTLPLTIIEDYLNPLCLAWWYQDDGHLKIQDGKSRKVILSTDSFTKTENEHLQHILKQKFSLTFSLDGQNRLILYDQPQIYYFLSIVKPFIHHSMDRKINIPIQEAVFPSYKRTTVYLPLFIKLETPTKDIYTMLEGLPILYRLISNSNSYHQLFKEVFPSLSLEKEKLEGYQIRLKEEQLTLLLECQQITGLRISQLIHLCFIINNKIKLFV